MFKGLSTDNDIALQPDGTYRYLLNGNLNNEEGCIVSDLGTTSLNLNIGGLQLVGSLSIISGSLLFLTDNTVSKILLFKEDTKTLEIIMDDTNYVNKFNFNTKYKIDAEYQFNIEGNLIIYWTDGLNPPRILNTKYNIPNTVNIEKFNLFNSFKKPVIIEDVKVGTNGNLIGGTYEFYVQYINYDNSTTNYIGQSELITLGLSTAKPEENTNLSIEFNINNIDKSYKALRISVIEWIQGETFRVKILPDVYIGDYIYSDNLMSYSFIYRGDENYISGSLEEILLDQVSYDTAKTLTQSNESLYLANLSKTDDIDYQKYANGIVVSAEFSEAFDDTSLGQKSFAPYEVYNLYISFIMKDGSNSRAFHIPGRINEGTELDIFVPDAQGAGLSGYNFHYIANVGTNNMAYWQNESKYPNTDDWDIWTVDVNGNGVSTGNTLKNQNIRLHRIPDAKKISDTQPYPSFYNCSLKFSNIKIPNNIKDKIIGYKIWFGAKTTSNTIVLDYSHIRYLHKNTNSLDSIYEGWSFTNKDSFVSGDENDYMGTYVVLSPVHMLSTDESLSTVKFLKGVFVTGTFNLTRVDAKAYIPEHTYKVTINKNFGLGQVGLYLPSLPDSMNETSNTVNNFYEEKKLLVLCPTSSYTPLPSGTCAICAMNTNPHYPFESEVLTYTGYTHTDLNDLDSDSIRGGSVALINATIWTLEATRTEDGATNKQLIIDQPDGTKVLSWDINTVQKSTSWPLRSLVRAKYIKSEREVNTNYDMTYIMNQYKNYNLAFWRNKSSKYSIPEGFNTLNVDYSTRIIRSQSGLNKESDNYRTFLDNNYIDLMKSKGEITALEYSNDTLYIFTNKTVFRTRGKEELKVGDVRAYIGSGDILSIAPSEIINTNEGYGGCIHINSIIKTQFGLFFVDYNNSKIFNISDNINEIQSYGMNKFFRDNIKFDIEKYGQFDPTKHMDYYNISLIFDPKYNRIFFIKKESVYIGEEPLSLIYDNEILKNGNVILDFSVDFEERYTTLSYSPFMKSWISFHDYKGDLFNTNSELYGVYNNNIYKYHNNKNLNFYNVDETFEYSFIENKPEIVYKNIENVGIRIDVIDMEDDKVLYHDIPNTIRIKNSYQDTGIIDLSLVNNMSLQHNIRKVNGSFYYNNIRDTENWKYSTTNVFPSWASKKRFNDSYCQVNITFENSTKDRMIKIYGTFANQTLKAR